MCKKVFILFLICAQVLLVSCVGNDNMTHTDSMNQGEIDDTCSDETKELDEKNCNETEQAILQENMDVTVISDAILYHIQQNYLEYNVTHQGSVLDAEIVDETGYNITSVSALQDVLASPDQPVPVLSEHTSSRTIGKSVTADLQVDKEGNIKTIFIKSVKERPVIGISWKMYEIGADYMQYAQMLERNGAIAVYLPKAVDAESAQSILSSLDGIFFTGGPDYHPSFFQQEVTPHGAYDWNFDRDVSDIHLMQQAVAMDVPLLAVCRGEQGLNVAMGGGLIQDVPYYLGQKVLNGEIDTRRVTKVLSGCMPGTDQVVTSEVCDGTHLRVEVDAIDHSRDRGYHLLLAGTDGIGISKDSKWLYPMFEHANINMISTAHHQAVDPEDLGEGITIAAMSSDGIVEAIERKENLFVVGLQWHPERDALGDSREVDVDQDACNIPIREFVKHAEIYQKR